MSNELSTANPDLLRFEHGPLCVSVLGGIRLSGLDRLRVTLKLELLRGVEPTASGYALRQNLDLYHATQVERLATSASERLGLEQAAVRKTLLELTDALERYRLREIGALAQTETVPKMTDEERAESRAFLVTPDLMTRTQEAIGESGIVGEEANRLLLFLAFTSRKLTTPLHAISLGPSGSGKTHLQEAVSRLIPEEDRIEITALTENALYYFAGDNLAGDDFGDDDFADDNAGGDRASGQGLRHKLLLIEDLDGAEAALYPLRELMSKGRLTKTLTVKDSLGRLRAVTVRAEGPVSVAGCSTRETLYEDNQNRALVLHTDQSPEQDEAVLAYQRRLAAGEVDRAEREAVRRLLQNAQRLLRPLRVVNPYTSCLRLPERVTRRRRTNRLYLAAIEAVALYHQHQRERRKDEATGEEVVVATLEDVAWANRLLAPVLVGRIDELSGACRRFFERLKAHLAEQSEEEQTEEPGNFRAADVRRALDASPSTLARHLTALRRFGLVEITGGTRAQGYTYRLTGADDFTLVAEAVEAELTAVLDQIREGEKQAGAKARKTKRKAKSVAR